MDRLTELTNLQANIRPSRKGLTREEFLGILRALNRGVSHKDILKVLGNKKTPLAGILGQWVITNKAEVFSKL